MHLLDNKEDVISKVHRMLNPGGVFVSSTICMGDSIVRLIKVVVPIGKFLGFLPVLKVFTAKDLEANLVRAGFAIDYQWQPAKGKAVFIVAKKAG